MSVQANCPACGGPCVFKVSTSLVTVCPYCQSVIARGDRGLESLGKVADLVTLRELVLEDATDAAAKDFQAEYDGSKPDGAPSVHVQLIARVGNAGDRRMLGHFEADARQPATANRLSAIVDAYDRAANQALLQIAADCAAALAPDSKAR